MSEQRLSKLQKWILTTCYKVTALLDNECLIPIDGKHTSLDPCCNCKVNGYHHNRDNKDNDFDGKPFITVKKDRYDCILNKCSRCRNHQCDKYTLYKEDILLSYFTLQKSKRYSFDRKQHFVDSPEYRKAHVTLYRSLKTLVTNEYIGLYGGGCYSTNIKLTEKGAIKAAELLDVEYTSLPLMTDEEKEIEFKEDEQFLRSLKLQAQALSKC